MLTVEIKLEMYIEEPSWSGSSSQHRHFVNLQSSFLLTLGAVAVLCKPEGLEEDGADEVPWCYKLSLSLSRLLAPFSDAGPVEGGISTNRPSATEWCKATLLLTLDSGCEPSDHQR